MGISRNIGCYKEESGCHHWLAVLTNQISTDEDPDVIACFDIDDCDAGNTITVVLDCDNDEIDFYSNGNLKRHDNGLEWLCVRRVIINAAW